MKPQKPAAKNSTVTVVLKRMPAKGEKIAPQALGILKALQALGGKATPTELRTEMPKHLKTVQTPARIFAYYRDALKKDKVIFIDDKVNVDWLHPKKATPKKAPKKGGK